MADPSIREFSPLQGVAVERTKQDAKWGEQNHGPLRWFAILGKEFGEVAECVTEIAARSEKGELAPEHEELLEYELLQVAAVCVAWVECIRRRERRIRRAKEMCTAKRERPAVDPERFGPHSFPHAEGTGDCEYGCGCWMGPYRSGGPVAPWGPCPENLKKEDEDDG